MRDNRDQPSRKPAAGQVISVAPMMDHTDRHCRYFFRLLAPDIGLYTEMLTARAVLHGDPARLLAFHPAEHPLALQLGGSESAELAAAARIAREFGYDEINLNVGCPSDRVRSGRFGACLMDEPDRVADCVRALADAWGAAPTVKTRIGIDDRDDYGFLARFVATVAAAGCHTFVIHARKAILSGLSPKQNRDIPPLRYDRVARLKADFPGLRIILNGGIRCSEQVAEQLDRFDGVMIGRQACSDPYWLAELQDRFLAPRRPPPRAAVVRRMAAYAEDELRHGERLHRISRHLLGLYAGQPGAARWRRCLSQRAVDPGAGPELLLEALEELAATA